MGTVTTLPRRLVPRDGEYVEMAHVVGEDEFTADQPYPVTVVPARLLD